MIWTRLLCLTCLWCGLLGHEYSQFSSLTMIWTGVCCHRTVGFPSGSDHQIYFYFYWGGALGSYFGGVNVVVAIPIYGEGVSKPVLMHNGDTVTSVRLSPLVHLFEPPTTWTSGVFLRASCSIW